MGGVILCFRELIQDALSTQLEERIPFLTSSIKDLHCHAGSPHESSLVAELACASGYSSKVDPSLLTTLRQTPKGETDDEYLTSCLLMVFVAVSIPKLARSESSSYQPQLEGHDNNIHCLASAVNQLLGGLFSIGVQPAEVGTGGGQGRGQEQGVCLQYILLNQIVQVSPFLSMDLLESCFPYTLLRNSYHSVHKGLQPVVASG